MNASSFNESDKMKIVFCILAILNTIHVSKQDLPDPTSVLQRLVNVQKTATELILNDLVSFQERIGQNVQVEVNNMKSNASLTVNEISNNALEEVKKSIETGKKEGKDVTSCYESAKHKIDAQIENAIAELETCVKNSQTIVEIPLENVAKTIQTAKALMTDLDTIIPNCYSSIFIKMQSCVLRKLYLSRTSLQGLKNNAKAVKMTAIIAYVSAINEARNCMTKPVADVRTGSADIIVATSSCVRNAKKSKTSR